VRLENESLLQKPESDQAYPAWRWLVLLAFSLNNACNAFMFMNFATVTALTKDIFSVDDTGANWLYSASLLAAMPTFFLVLSYITTHNWKIHFLCAFLNLVGAYLRYQAVVSGSYTLAQLSSIAIGLSAAVILVSITDVAKRWFAPAQQTLAITIAVQSNYSGWCLGGFLTPNICAFDDTFNGGEFLDCDVTRSQFEFFLLVQAVVVTLVMVIFVAFYRASPDTLRGHPDSVRSTSEGEGEGEDEGTIVGNLSELSRNGPYVVKMFAFSVLGGISFAITAVQGEVFTNPKYGAGLTNAQSSITNTVFILSGVIAGISLAFCAKDDKHFEGILKGLFALCTVSLTVMTGMTEMQDTTEASGVPHNVIFGIYVVLMMGAGISSLGFIGIALSRAVQVAKPVGEAYSGGLVEWWIQVWGAILAQVTTGESGFTVVMLLAWAALLALQFEAHLVKLYMGCIACFPASTSADADDKLSK